jgi:hypothetical protein
MARVTDEANYFLRPLISSSVREIAHRSLGSSLRQLLVLDGDLKHRPLGVGIIQSVRDGARFPCPLSPVLRIMDDVRRFHSAFTSSASAHRRAPLRGCSPRRDRWRQRRARARAIPVLSATAAGKRPGRGVHTRQAAGWLQGASASGRADVQSRRQALRDRPVKRANGSTWRPFWAVPVYFAYQILTPS